MPPSAENLPRDPDVLTKMVVELACENEHLRTLLKACQGMVFGSRSEKASVILDGQERLDLGDLASDVVPEPANDDEPGHDDVSARPRRKKAKRNIGALPLHLPRVDNVIEPESTQCACCAGALHKIGEDVSEAADIIPAILRVIRTIRPKYACRACEGAIVQAPAPRRLIEGGMATTSLMAWVAASKFAWSMPLNRIAEMLKGQGINIDRSTLARWVKSMAWWLDGLYERQLRFIHRQSRIFCDETRMPVQNPGGGKVRIAQFWTHAVDDRPWNGPAPPAVCYVYAQSRSHREINDQLATYQGILQVDGYGGYKRLEKAGRPAGPIQLAFCLAHARRYFVDLHRVTQSPVTAQIIAQIGKVYAVEARIRGTSAEHRLEIRQAESRALMITLKETLEDTLALVSKKSKLAQAIRYALGHWRGLTRFLDDGRIEVDNNTVERSIRPVALGRRNFLFAGNDGGAETWAVLGSLLQSARLNGLDPYTWLNDVLERIVSGEVKNNELDQLLAWNWEPRTAAPLLAMAA